MDAAFRKWAMQWAVRLDRDPEKFLRQLEKVDLKTATDEEVEKALDLPPNRGTYIKRGWGRFGKAKKKQGPITSTGAINFRIYEKAKKEMQKIIDQEVLFENKLIELRKKKEEYNWLPEVEATIKKAVVKWEQKSKK